MVTKFRFGNRIVPPNHESWGKIPGHVTGRPTSADRRNTGWRGFGRRKADRVLFVGVLCCITLYALLATIFVMAMVHGEFASWLFG